MIWGKLEVTTLGLTTVEHSSGIDINTSTFIRRINESVNAKGAKGASDVIILHVSFLYANIPTMIE